MMNCGTCKHWKKTDQTHTGICTITYLQEHGGVSHLCWDRRGGCDEVTTGKIFGCIHWEELPKPFHVEGSRHVSSTTECVCASDWQWSVVHEDGRDIEIYWENERAARRTCEILNEFWRKDKSSG